jgi:hypothetical protein
MSVTVPPTREAQIHRAIVGWLVLQLPQSAVLHHSPNEVDMRGPDVARAIAKARAMGTRKGWPDIEIVWNGAAYFFEVKTGSGRLSEAQRETHERLRAAGANVATIRSVEDARAALQEWGIL